ncbi:unnamed protein product [Prorocentrum cordatum]|uniref:Uncharacterized protein n=1 Tax=Prorocentrum cordatum TaxID=2364126 RepID=A0ABN9WKZ9_9DINO|nr:unnamed protein product [Polarella glacialis]
MRVGALQSPSNKLLPFADYRRGNVKRAKKVEGLSCDVDWSGDEESNSDPLRFQTDSQAKASAPVSTLTPSATPSTSVSDTELEMRRVNTLGDIFQDSARLEFCRQVSMCSDTGSVRPLNEGQTGEVFAVVDEGGEKVAVFKPAGREHFHRRDLFPGQGAIREEAAYIIDRLCGGVAGLPITARTTLEAGEADDDSILRTSCCSLCGRTLTRRCGRRTPLRWAAFRSRVAAKILPRPT